MVSPGSPLVAFVTFVITFCACAQRPSSDDPDLAGSATLPQQDLSLAPPLRDLSAPHSASDLSSPAGTSRLRFVAMGDAGKGNVGQALVAAAVKQKCDLSGCDFVQLLGDNIYSDGVSSTSDLQWQTKFELPYSQIQLPFYVVLGNHDYGGGGGGNEFFKAQFEIDYSAHSSKWKLPAAYWHRVDKQVEFFGLDTNMILYDMYAQQQSDMHAWVSTSTALWKIALGHHPYKSNGPHGNAGHYDGSGAGGTRVKSFVDAEICGKVDLYLAGHDHSNQWLTETCLGTEIVVAGAGADTTSLPGSNPTRYQSLSSGFLYVDISDRTLTASFIDTLGTVAFTRTIVK